MRQPFALWRFSVFLQAGNDGVMYWAYPHSLEFGQLRTPFFVGKFVELLAGETVKGRKLPGAYFTLARPSH